jgi:hypothetical protein
LAITDLDEPSEDANGYYYVKPPKWYKNKKYTFYVEVKITGDKVSYLGPYTLDVGCTSTSVSWTAGKNILKEIMSGDSGVDVFTFVSPSTGRSYCDSK